MQALVSTRLEPVTFDSLPGWPEDDHARAMRAFLRSAGAFRSIEPAASASFTLRSIATRALDPSRRIRPHSSECRVFFEHFFVPHRVLHDGKRGLFTGYYEPVVEGARTPSARFHVPLYRRPPDLETVVPETDRARAGHSLTHMRRTPSGLEPFPTRAEIDAGALAGRGLELIWLADQVDAFFAQVQGSLRVRLPDGTRIGLTYDGKNGHPYTSIGRVLVERGEIPAAAMTMQSLAAWLRADATRARALMQQNQSFVFFREGADAHATGALGTPLVPGRSLAVDTAHHALGLPIYVDVPSLLHAGSRRPFRRLMVAHDVGSAIRGAERGDIYFGSGDLAAARAGITKHRGNMFVLLPLIGRGRAGGGA